MDIAHRHKAFPIGLVTTGRTLLLVGGCGAHLCRLHHALHFDWKCIAVVCPESQPELCSACPNDPRVRVAQRRAREEDVEQADLVIESTENEAWAKDLDQWCATHRVPLNAMDKLAYCDLHYPALLLKDVLTIAILSGGDAPALSSRLRKELDQFVGPGWTTAARLFSETRNNLPGGQTRIHLLKRLAQDPKLKIFIEKNDESSMKKWIQDEVNRI